MRLSIIIVNYNVPYFLEQCLLSVRRAIRDMDAEVWVVDNASADNSLAYLKPRFPEVLFMANIENIGFGKANNQALEHARGKHVLFLNPDTLLEEDTLEKTVSFLEKHAEAGALGVRMVDGNGRFLRESKRAFPDPVTSFYKLSGLSALFPHSPRFGRYHLGHIPENTLAEVDVLAGAFLMVKKEVLDRVGGFDPQFFMYGEDIDLSFRIQQSGYKNYYFPETTIIHFKGESTKKGSLNYVRMFYQAMNIFVEKHYSGQKRVNLFRRAIQLGIAGRAAVSAIRRFILKAGIPVIDALFVVFSYLICYEIWKNFIKPENDYRFSLLAAAVGGSVLLMWCIHYWMGLYDRRLKLLNIFRSALLQITSALAVYSLLPEEWRFSRGIVFCSLLLFYVFCLLFRWILVKNRMLIPEETLEEEKSALVLASEEDMGRVESITARGKRGVEIIGRISPGSEEEPNAVGPWLKPETWVKKVSIQEIICCFSPDIEMKTIIAIRKNVPREIRFLYSGAGSGSIIGSDSANSAGRTFSSHRSANLARKQEKRNKRLTDLLVASGLLLAWPVLCLFNRRRWTLLKNIYLVCTARKTWIGYASSGRHLPFLPKGVLTTTGMPEEANNGISQNTLERMDRRYAMHYSFSKDISLLRRGWRWLGR